MMEAIVMNLLRYFPVILFSGFLSASSTMAAESLLERKVPSKAEGESSVSLFKMASKAGVPEEPLREAFEYFDQHRANIKNQRYLTIVDYSLPNTKQRLFVIDLDQGEVEKRLASHGAGRDDRSNPRDIPIYFSNTPDSREGSIGFFITGTEYPS
ncbi:MAG: murein L,D-transpeptidase catalytic domain-containing protein, partial [Opitutales bacterium]